MLCAVITSFGRNVSNILGWFESFMWNESIYIEIQFT